MEKENNKSPDCRHCRFRQERLADDQELFCCDEHPDCFANSDGRCTALTDWNFDERDCPFYKARAVNQKEQEEIFDDLIETRPDLLAQYSRVYVQLGLMDSIASDTDVFAAEMKKYAKQLRNREAAGK